MVAAAGVTAVLGQGCSISPMPEPPAEQPTVELGDLTTKLPHGTNDPVAVEGSAGAASPPGATVRVFNLDTADPPAESVVRDDGSFTVELNLDVGQEARIQVLTATGRSTPVDFVAVANAAPPQPTTHALGSCLFLAPPLELDAAAGSAVAVSSECPSAVTIEAPVVRRAVPGFQVGTGGSWPAVLGSGDTLPVSVEFQASPGTLEEIFFIQASAPQQDRRPVTVFPATG
jgi:hypothetical protein